MEYVPNTRSNSNFMFIAKRLGLLYLQLFLPVHTIHQNIFLDNEKYLSHS